MGCVLVQMGGRSYYAFAENGRLKKGQRIIKVPKERKDSKGDVLPALAIRGEWEGRRRSGLARTRAAHWAK